MPGFTVSASPGTSAAQKLKIPPSATISLHTFIKARNPVAPPALAVCRRLTIISIGRTQNWTQIPAHMPCSIDIAMLFRCFFFTTAAAAAALTLNTFAPRREKKK